MDIIIEIQSGIVVIEGFLQFERVDFVLKKYFRFRLLQVNEQAMSRRIGKVGQNVPLSYNSAKRQYQVNPQKSAKSQLFEYLSCKFDPPCLSRYEYLCANILALRMFIS
jgi:hypothetical protein